MVRRHSRSHRPSLLGIAVLAAIGAAVVVVALLVVSTVHGPKHGYSSLGRPHAPRVHVYTAPTGTYAPNPALPPPPTTASPAAPKPVPGQQPLPQQPVRLSHIPSALTARCRDGSISNGAHGPLCYGHGGIRYTL
jgi:hypothetical protein